MVQKTPENELKESIESLARMVASGFNHVDRQFEKVASKKDLYSLENNMDEHFKEVCFRIDQLKYTQGQQIDGLEQRVGVLETVN